MNSDTSAGGIDREGVGMLYAGGTGVMIGTSIVYGTSPSLGWVLGSVVLLSGLSYEAYQRKLQRDTDD